MPVLRKIILNILFRVTFIYSILYTLLSFMYKELVLNELEMSMLIFILLISNHHVVNYDWTLLSWVWRDCCRPKLENYYVFALPRNAWITTTKPGCNIMRLGMWYLYCVRKDSIICSLNSLCTYVIMTLYNLFPSLPDNFVIAYCHLLGSAQNCPASHQMRTVNYGFRIW